MSVLPVIVGFGGFNAAGRSSFHHAYRRMIIDVLSQEDRINTYYDLATMMKLLRFENGTFINDAGEACQGWDGIQRYQDYIHQNTLIRRITDVFYDPDKTPFNQSLTLKATDQQTLQLRLSKADLPDNLPPHWKIQPVSDSKDQYDVIIPDGMQVFLPTHKKALVQSAGQLPTGFNPADMYAAKNHPRGLQMTIIGASDAVKSTGIDWNIVLQHLNPDQVGVYAGSAMNQMNTEAAGGYMRASALGKRANTKQMPFSFLEMPGDFINAYILGNVGHTCTSAGACATFLYNLNVAMQDIKSGRVRAAVVGNSESPIIPELIEAYRVMSALSEDTQLQDLDGLSPNQLPNYARATRPFGENKGFTVAESAQFVVLFDDELALELGAEIYAALADIHVHADGIKKSISQPGAGNYISFAKAAATVQAMLGDDVLKNKTYIQSHGTGTPQNRVTESHVFNEIAKIFQIQNWPVTAVKAYVGHSIGPSAGDQLVAALGTWKYGWIPGIYTVDKIADDVHHDHLNILLQHLEVGKTGMDAALINTKGFGGNNATGVLLAPHIAYKMLQKKHGQQVLNKYAAKNETVRNQAVQYDQSMIQNQRKPIYLFGEKPLEWDDFEFNQNSIQIKNFPQQIKLPKETPFPDMEIK